MAPNTGSKRARAVADSSESEDETSVQAPTPRRRAPKQNGLSRTHGNGNGNGEGASGEYQPGAITRVKLTNFVTYENAVFYPGPNLNMVIGPNGTGKSSLVCAICIGLGYATVHLGRAAKFGEFVKHGKDEAFIEIELQRRPEDDENYTIKVRVTRDGDKRKWWINGADASLKNVQQLTSSLGIQCDNLCQFLPQDRVSEFAGLSSIDLLHETQRAAAPPEMLAWHDELKELRKQQKEFQLKLDTDQETLNVQEERQEGLRGDVERLQERAEIQTNINRLEKSVPFVEYKAARREWKSAKARNREANAQLAQLEREVQPTLQQVNDKQDYQRQIEVVVREREKVLKEAERAADAYTTQIERVDEDVKNVEQEKKAEVEGEKVRKQALAGTERKIRELEAQLSNQPPAFDAAEWNAKIRAKEHKIRDIEAEHRNIDDEIENYKRQGNEIRNTIGNSERDLKTLESQAGQNLNKLRAQSRDTAQFWQWIQENQNRFEKEVHAPPLISCNLKDVRYADAIESLMQRSDYLIITAQCQADFRILSDEYNTQRLGDINLRVASHRPPTERVATDQELKDLALDGWAIDYIEAPEPVLAMLCANKSLHRAAVALRDITEQQYDAIMRTRIPNVAAGKTLYNVSRRAEYGAGATSTSTKSIVPARNWTNAPVDTGATQDIFRKIEELKRNFEVMKADVHQRKERMQQLHAEKSEILREIERIRAEKSRAQIAHGQFAAIPQKLENQKEIHQAKKAAGQAFKATMQQYQIQMDNLALKRSELILEYKSKISAIRSAHHSLLESRLRSLEAESDVEALSDANKDIVRRVEETRRDVARADQDMKTLKEKAQHLLDVCQKHLGTDQENSDYWNAIPDDLTLEQLEADIDAERSKLDYIHEGDPQALQQFEQRKAAIADLQRKISRYQKRLDGMNDRINELKAAWEPQLDALIAEISAAFAHNFERIGCAGEVGVHKDSDFDLWSIEIKVKFRENESLQLLDQHRQSGGERSVSTIFYLMALQSLARSPFRVVDEINQGMDPRNERMVHERMVEIACKEHTSQYFLITPKLLTGLRYDPRMRVLCIASGEHMPGDATGLDFRRVIAMRRALGMARAMAVKT